MAAITVSNPNAAAKAGNGLGPKTRIYSLSMTDMTQAKLDAAILALTTGVEKGVNDAVSIAGVSAFEAGVTDVVYVAVQGTGVLTAANDWASITDVDLALVTTFEDNV